MAPCISATRAAYRGADVKATVLLLGRTTGRSDDAAEHLRASNKRIPPRSAAMAQQQKQHRGPSPAANPERAKTETPEHAADPATARGQPQGRRQQGRRAREGAGQRAGGGETADDRDPGRRNHAMEEKVGHLIVAAGASREHAERWLSRHGRKRVELLIGDKATPEEAADTDHLGRWRAAAANRDKTTNSIRDWARTQTAGRGRDDAAQRERRADRDDADRRRAGTRADDAGARTARTNRVRLRNGQHAAQRRRVPRSGRDDAAHGETAGNVVHDAGSAGGAGVRVRRHRRRARRRSGPRDRVPLEPDAGRRGHAGRRPADAQRAEAAAGARATARRLQRGGGEPHAGAAARSRRIRDRDAGAGN